MRNGLMIFDYGAPTDDENTTLEIHTTTNGEEVWSPTLYNDDHIWTLLTSNDVIVCFSR